MEMVQVWQGSEKDFHSIHLHAKVQEVVVFPSPAGGAGILTANKLAHSNHNGMGMAQLWQDCVTTSSFNSLFSHVKNRNAVVLRLRRAALAY